MTATSPNVATALAHLESVRALDTHAFAARFAPDARVWLPGQGWMPVAGLAALLDGARPLLTNGICFTHERVIDAGDSVVVLTGCDSPLANGKSYVNQFCFVFTFRADGLIAEMREYTDSSPAIAAFHS